jgi:hypothetical protein
VELDEISKSVVSIENDIYETACNTPDGCDSLVWPLGVPSPHKPSNRHDVIRWDYFNLTHLYLGTDFDVIEEQSAHYRADVDEVIATAVENLNRDTAGRYIYRTLINGYKQFDPTRGSQYILDLLLYDTLQSIDVHKRVDLMRPLGLVEIMPMPYVTEMTKVHLVVAFTSDYDSKEIDSFFKNYALFILGNLTRFLVFILVLTLGQTRYVRFWSLNVLFKYFLDV